MQNILIIFFNQDDVFKCCCCMMILQRDRKVEAFRYDLPSRGYWSSQNVSVVIDYYVNSVFCNFMMPISSCNIFLSILGLVKEKGICGSGVTVCSLIHCISIYWKSWFGSSEGEGQNIRAWKGGPPFVLMLNMD